MACVIGSNLHVYPSIMSPNAFALPEFWPTKTGSLLKAWLPPEARPGTDGNDLATLSDKHS